MKASDFNSTLQCRRCFCESFLIVKDFSTRRRGGEKGILGGNNKMNILFLVEVKPWIRCPDIIIQDLLPGKSSADVSGVWKEPTSNLQPSQITINPPEMSSSYQFPPGTTKITWTASNAVGSESCSIYVIISGNLFCFIPFYMYLFSCRSAPGGLSGVPKSSPPPFLL